MMASSRRTHRRASEGELTVARKRTVKVQSFKRSWKASDQKRIHAAMRDVDVLGPAYCLGGGTATYTIHPDHGLIYTESFYDAEEVEAIDKILADLRIENLRPMLLAYFAEARQKEADAYKAACDAAGTDFLPF